MKKLYFLLAIMLLPLIAKADASGTCGENVTWTFEEATGILTISGSGPMDEGTSWSQWRSYILKVVIEDGVTSIGYYAFEDCSNLAFITIPNSVTYIKSRAFFGCSSLTSITIPNSVTSIDYIAFYGCSSLSFITIPNSVTNIGMGAFWGCTGLKTIKVEEGNAVYDSREDCNAIIDTKTNCLLFGSQTAKIPNSVTSIGDYAFSGFSGFSSITFQNSVTSIGQHAFYGCRLENVLTKNSKASCQDAFSDRTYQHAMLYIPEGTWGEAVYDGDWYQFNNIRELAMEKDDISQARAYTLMDTESFGYAVYDPASNEVKMVKAFYSMDEQDVNNCWQMIKKNGQQYLYNLGAKKYASIASNGKITLTADETPIPMDEGENGVKLGANGKEWGFVKNNAVQPDENLITPVQVQPGDANVDGNINITDVTYIIDKINNRPSANFNQQAADVNGDGEVNITDVTLVLDIINQK